VRRGDEAEFGHVVLVGPGEHVSTTRLRY